MFVEIQNFLSNTRKGKKGTTHISKRHSALKKPTHLPTNHVQGSAKYTVEKQDSVRFGPKISSSFSDFPVCKALELGNKYFFSFYRQGDG